MARQATSGPFEEFLKRAFVAGSDVTITLSLGNTDLVFEATYVLNLKGFDNPREHVKYSVKGNHLEPVSIEVEN